MVACTIRSVGGLSEIGVVVAIRNRGREIGVGVAIAIAIGIDNELRVGSMAI